MNWRAKLSRFVSRWVVTEPPSAADMARAAYEAAQAEWSRQKSRYILAKERKDARLQGEIIRELTKANCALLRAERAVEGQQGRVA